MDYAGEELKRQYRALAALLTGGGAAEQRREPPGEKAGEMEDGGGAVGAEAVLWDDGAADVDGAMAEAERAFARVRRDGDASGAFWRTGPFREDDGAFGVRVRSEEFERTSGRRGGGTGVPPARTGNGGETVSRDAAAVGSDERERREGSDAAYGGARDAVSPETRYGGAETVEAWSRNAGMEPERSGERRNGAVPDVTGSRGGSWSGQGQAVTETLPRDGETADELGWTSGYRRAAAQSAETAGARALSLAFQRDARRYDGGFSLL